MVVIALLPLAAGVLPVGASDRCRERLAEWSETYARLRDAVAHLKQSTSQDLRDRIAKEIEESDGRSSIAAAVRKVLRERDLRLEEQRERVRTLRRSEKTAYSHCRSCLHRSRAGNGEDTVPEETLKERKELVAQIPGLLLDEAYIQYKNYRAPTPPSDQNYYWRYTYQNAAPQGRRRPQRGYYPGRQMNRGYMVAPGRSR